MAYETSSGAMEFKPGLFHLRLNVNNLTPERAIKGRQTSMQCVLDEDFGPLHLAANNLMGLLCFYVKNNDEAESCFERVLERDPHNLNALANLKHMYEVRKMKIEAKDFDERLQRAMAGTRAEQILRKARCRAEQAYCIGFECLKSDTDMRRFEASQREFSKAIQEVTEAGLNNDTTTNGRWSVSAEVKEWKLCQVWNFKRIYNLMYKERQEERPDVFHQVLQLLCELQKDVGGQGGLMEAQVFTYIAYFFWKQPQHPNPMLPETRELIAQNKLECYLENPESCHEKAMEICSSSSDVANQYACYILYEQRDRFQKAVDDLTSVLVRHKSWFALSKRGEVLKKWYKQERKDELLLRAEKDFKEVSEMNPSSFVFTHLGETYFLLGTDRSGDQVRDKKYLVKALDSLQKAENTGDPDYGKSYRLMADCHRLLGQTEEELRALKRSLEKTEASNKCLVNARRLLELLILHYKEEREKIPPEANIEGYSTAKSAFIDVFYWMVTFCFKHFRAEDVINTHVQELVDGNEEIFADIRAALTSLPNESERLKRVDYVMGKAGVDVQQLQQRAKAWDVRGQGLCPLPPPETARCKEFEYDFFVLHALLGDEEWWVSCRLIPALEDEINSEARLKGFRMERDSKSNGTEPCNPEFAIQHSRKIIVVLSPAFIESPSLEHALHMTQSHVLEKRKVGLDKVIVPVIFENCEVPESLAYLRALDISNAIDDSDLSHIRRAVES